MCPSKNADLQLERGSHFHIDLARLIHKTTAKSIFGPTYLQRNADGRVLEVEKREKNKRNYKYLYCAFSLNRKVKKAVLSIIQLKISLKNYYARQYDSPCDDPLYEIHNFFENNNNSAVEAESDDIPHGRENVQNCCLNLLQNKNINQNSS